MISTNAAHYDMMEGEELSMDCVNRGLSGVVDTSFPCLVDSVNAKVCDLIYHFIHSLPIFLLRTSSVTSISFASITDRHDGEASKHLR